VQLFVSASGAPHLHTVRTILTDLPDGDFIAGLRSTYDGGVPDEVMQSREMIPSCGRCAAGGRI
jgi:surfactin synthase thioesterase subunit